MKKILLFLFLVFVFSDIYAQKIFAAGDASWVMFISLPTEDTSEADINPRIDYKKEGTNKFVSRNADSAFLSLAITPVVSAITRDSSLLVLNLHALAVSVSVLGQNGIPSSIILDRGEYRELSFAEWGGDSLAFSFQEIVDDYQGVPIIIPLELFNSEGIDEYVGLIASGLLPHWNFELSICDLALVKSKPKEVKFRFRIQGEYPLDERIGLGLKGIYLDNSWIKGRSIVINSVWSGINIGDDLFVAITSTDKALDSDFILVTSETEFKNILYRSTKEEYSFSFKSCRQEVKDTSPWFMKNGVGSRY